MIQSVWAFLSAPTRGLAPELAPAVTRSLTWPVALTRPVLLKLLLPPVLALGCGFLPASGAVAQPRGAGKLPVSVNIYLNQASALGFASACRRMSDAQQKRIEGDRQRLRKTAASDLAKQLRTPVAQAQERLLRAENALVDIIRADVAASGCDTPQARIQLKAWSELAGGRKNR